MISLKDLSSCFINAKNYNTQTAKIFQDYPGKKENAKHVANQINNREDSQIQWTVSGNVLYQKRIVVEPGENVIFNLTTQHGNPILATQFGLKGKGGNMLRKFIVVTKFRGIECGDDFNTSEGWRYKTRVFFVGNITLGHAWFKIANIQENDTNTYQVDIREITDEKYKMYTVDLLVRRKNESSPTSPEPSPTTTSKPPELTSSTKTPTSEKSSPTASEPYPTTTSKPPELTSSTKTPTSEKPSPTAPEPTSSTLTPTEEIGLWIGVVAGIITLIFGPICLVIKCKEWNRKKTVSKINSKEDDESGPKDNTLKDVALQIL